MQLPLYSRNILATGFSLVELSIVLVILGLLTGGILSGQSLIKAAELRGVPEEYQQFQTAINLFEQKYFATPGDMTNATLFWGKLSVCNGHTGTLNPNGTCNGDNDGLIEAASAPDDWGERFMFWRQLALAGFLEGTYSGIVGDQSVSHTIININIPGSTISQAGWAIERQAGTGETLQYDSWAGMQFLEYGSYDSDGNHDQDAPVLTPEDAWNIDKKMDDGLPAYGIVIARYYADECAYALDGNHTSNNYEAEYKVSDNSIKCSLMFAALWE